MRSSPMISVWLLMLPGLLISPLPWMSKAALTSDPTDRLP